jgi:hypothetical protein
MQKNSALAQIARAPELHKSANFGGLYLGFYLSYRNLTDIEM